MLSMIEEIGYPSTGSCFDVLRGILLVSSTSVWIYLILAGISTRALKVEYELTFWLISSSNQFNNLRC